MGKNFSSFYFIVISLLCAGSLMGCPFAQKTQLESVPTAIGNPGEVYPDVPGRAVPETLCSVYSDCFGDAPEHCMARVMAVNDVSSSLGVPRFSYVLGSPPEPTWLQILNMERDGMRASENAVRSCVGELESLSCSDPDLISAYNGSRRSQYGAAAVLNSLPTTPCKEIYFGRR